MNEKEIIRKCRRLRDAQTEPETVLFAENYTGGGNQGIITSLFLAYLKNPSYAGCRLVWVARDYEACIERFAEALDSDRVWIVTEGGSDYIRFLCTAGKIYSGSLLPSYFIKKSGQKVVMVLDETVTVRHHYNKRLLLSLVPSLNKADEIIVDENTAKALEFMGNPGLRGKVRLHNYAGASKVQPEAKKVFFSFQNNNRSAKTPGIFEYIYEVLGGFSAAYKFEADWQVSLLLYRKIRKDERLRTKFKNVRCNEDDCTDIIAGSELVVTDNIISAFRAVRMKKRTILFASETIETDYGKILDNVTVVFGFEQLAAVLEDIMSGKKAEVSFDDLFKAPVLFDCPDELTGEGGAETLVRTEQPLSGGGPQETAERLKKILIVPGWTGNGDLTGGLNSLAESYRDRADITIVYRSSMNGKLYNDLGAMSAGVRFYVRNGDIQCEEKDRELLLAEGNATASEAERVKNIVADEWRRMLGDEKYDLMICMQSTHRLWNSIYSNPPSAKKVFYTQSDAVKVTGSVKKHIDSFLESDET